jgi:hypothetical protein
MPYLWGVYRREHATIATDYGNHWSREVVALLEKRWQLLRTLTEREHGSGRS